MKQVWEFMKIAYENLTKMSTRALAIIIIMMPLALYVTYKGYTSQHKRNENMVELIQKVNDIDSNQVKMLSNQQAQSVQISLLYGFIDQAIKASSVQVIQSTAEQMKFLLKWNKENSAMLQESIDNWSNTYQRNITMSAPDIPADTLPHEYTGPNNGALHIGVKKK